MDAAEPSTGNPTRDAGELPTTTAAPALVGSPSSIPQENWVITPGEVHVWVASLDEFSPTLPAWMQALSAAEHARAKRFQFDRDRDRFIVRRGLLRRILARYLDADAARLSFNSDPRGKPVLADAPAGTTLHFNLSHSHGLVLFAIAVETPVGIDVERVRPMPDTDRIAAQFFSARENAALAALPAESKLEAFFNGWTRKEAYLKATGEGIADALTQIEVSLAPDDEPRLVRIAGDAQAAMLWSLRALTPATGFVGALAVKARGVKLLCRSWPCESE